MDKKDVKETQEKFNKNKKIMEKSQELFDRIEKIMKILGGD